MHGIPSIFDLKVGEKIIFKYYNYYDSDLKFKLTREYGYADISITTCENNQEVEFCLD